MEPSGTTWPISVASSTPNRYFRHQVIKKFRKMVVVVNAIVTVAVAVLAVVLVVVVVVVVEVDVAVGWH